MWTKDMKPAGIWLSICLDAIYVQTDYMEYGRTPAGHHERVTARVRDNFRSITSHHAGRLIRAANRGELPQEWRTFEISESDAAANDWPEELAGTQVTVYVHDELYIITFPYITGGNSKYARDVQMYIAGKVADELREEFINESNLSYQKLLLRS